jgi:iron-sulfur cluster assembly protein
MRSRLAILVLLALGLGVCRQGLSADAPATQPASRSAEAIVTLTEKAATEIRAVAATQAFARYWLRVGVRAQPGSEKFRYLLDITEEKPDANADSVFDSQGVTIAVDHKSAIYLLGTVIDFRDDAAGRGFVFRNPNAMEK